ncbi:MAG: HAMP domain-containing protein [Gammaproteobacteria bacterium]|nr:HAMP domain-containing protein [Gammaproteobacteria bacterium]MBU1655315.1 HAMP domain-containing protein [Gammaproteobacteria bacterium]MBU1961460.1 HAMP domain-containing protein [Gammaproteobacteria bacterium]
MVVALQIPIEEIDKVMQQRAGMGQTGETYLVGPDKRMRSTSYLDPQNRSVTASFAGTVERNGVDTVAAREALEGRSGTRILSNYSGATVLSAFAPIRIGGQTWAVIAELNATEAFAAISQLEWLMATIILLAVVVNLGVSLWLARSITRPVTEAVALSSAVAEGRLDRTLTTDRGDEVGQLIRCLGDMSAKLRRIVAQVRGVTDHVVTAAGEISKGNMDLSQRTEEQASSLEETAASMEELTSTVKQNAENAVQANRLAADARKQAEEGGGVAGRAMQAMTAINNSSKRIADIIGVIDEIAFQTNLLSLNAAVEAARAGEHGRGFAVVADEVRKLAQRSADAAKEIKALITDSVGKVEEGSRLVDESGRALSEIIGAVKQVSHIVAEITAASREQSVGIEQVNKAVVQMDEVTQQNASLVEEAAAAAASLEDQAKQLQRSIAFFKLGDGDEPSENRAPAQLPPPTPKLAGRTASRLGPDRRAKGAETNGDEWEEF